MLTTLHTALSESSITWLLLCAVLGLSVSIFVNWLIPYLPYKLEQEWQAALQNEEASTQSLPAANPYAERYHNTGRCRHCHKPLRWYQRLALLSLLCGKRRCQHCQQSFSFQPVLVALSCLTLFVAAGHQFGVTLYTFNIFILLTLLIAATFIDFETLLLPDQLTLPLMWLGFILALGHIGPITLDTAVIGAIFGYLLLWSVYWIFKLITGKEGMGYGDFKLLAALGA